MNRGCVYILALEQSRFYVGYTTEPRHRIKTHFKGGCTKVTTKYKPISIIKIYRHATKKLEHIIMCNMRDRVGRHRVRGGGWTTSKDF